MKPKDDLAWQIVNTPNSPDPLTGYGLLKLSVTLTYGVPPLSPERRLHLSEFGIYGSYWCFLTIYGPVNIVFAAKVISAITRVRARAPNVSFIVDNSLSDLMHIPEELLTPRNTADATA